MKNWLVPLFLVLLFSRVMATSVYEVRQGSVLEIKAPAGSYAHVFDAKFVSDKNGKILIGVDIYQKPGTYPVYLMDCSQNVCIKTIYGELVVVERYKTIKTINPNRTPARQVEIDRTRAVLGNPGDHQLASGKFVNPLDKIDERSFFGSKRPYHYHAGVDLRTCDTDSRGHLIRGKCDKPVYSINSGKIAYFGYSSVEGKMVIIDHGSGVFSLYMHLSDIEPMFIGMEVESGRQIGISGTTGNATAWTRKRIRGKLYSVKIEKPHLHFEIKIIGKTDSGVLEASVDPMEFLENRK